MEPYELVRLGYSYQEQQRAAENVSYRFAGKPEHKEILDELVNLRRQWDAITPEQRKAASVQYTVPRPRKLTDDHIAKLYAKYDAAAVQEEGTEQRAAVLVEYAAAKRVAHALTAAAENSTTPEDHDDAIAAWDKVVKLLEQLSGYRGSAIGDEIAPTKLREQAWLRAAEVYGTVAWHSLRDTLRYNTRPANLTGWGAGWLVSTAERRREELAHAQKAAAEAEEELQNALATLHKMDLQEWVAKGLDVEAAEVALALAAAADAPATE